MKVKTHLAIFAALTCAVFASGCAAPTKTITPLFLHNEKIADVELSDLAGLWLVTRLDGNDSGSQQKTVIEYRHDGTVSGSVGMTATAAGVMKEPRLTISGRWVINRATITHSDMIIRSVDDSVEGRLLSELLNSSGRELGGTATILELTATSMITVDAAGTHMKYVRYTALH